MEALRTPAVDLKASTEMKLTAKHFAPWLAAVAAVGAVTLAPVASADTNRDEADQTAGAVSR